MSIGFKVSDSQKQLINNTLERVAKHTGLNKGDSLVYIIESFSNKQIGNESGEYIKPNVRDVLQYVDCPYIEHSDEIFWCLEKAHTSKKKDNLGVDPENVKRFCIACKQGKADLIEKRNKEERRKESFKRLERFLKQFMTITEKGFIAETYMCLCNAIEGNLIYSRDGKSLQCPLEENDIVQIQDVCMNALNPKTGLPPCHYLVTLEHLVQLTKEDIEKMDIDLPQIDYLEPDEPSSNTLRKEHRKEIDAEYEVKEEEQGEEPE